MQSLLSSGSGRVTWQSPSVSILPMILLAPFGTRGNTFVKPYLHAFLISGYFDSVLMLLIQSGVLTGESPRLAFDFLSKLSRCPWFHLSETKLHLACAYF